jgi:hypothetical protein
MIANETGTVPAHLRRIGYLPQDGGLFPHLSRLCLLLTRLRSFGGVADCVLGRIAIDDVAYEGHARIMLRPEQVQIGAACSGSRDGARWQVEQVDFEGFSSLFTMRAIGTTSPDEPPSLTVRGLSARALQRGARVKVTVIVRVHTMPS